MLSDGFFATLVDIAPDALVVYDDHSVITYVNQQTEQLFGYERGELLGARVETLVPARFRTSQPPAHTDTHSGVFPAAEDVPGLCALRKDGSEFPVEISLSPMDTPDGSCTIAAIRAHREQQPAPPHHAAAASGDTRDKLKTEFLANMSHELRSPLNAIIGFAKLMYNGRVGAVSEAHREYLGDILTSAEHLLHVINDVVDLSKVEAGRMDFHPEPVSLQQLLQDVHASLQGIASSKQIRFELRVDPACDAAELDPEKLRQVLYNFLSNALKFTADGGSIQLRATLEDAERVRFEVSDTGPGVREEDIAELWKPFRQLDPVAAKRHPGAGLGLTLTKRIVEQQGGRIGVNSQVGRGSTFFAVLPRKHVIR